MSLTLALFCSVLRRNLVVGFLVAMHDQAVQEASWLTVGLFVVFLGILDLAADIGRGFFVGFVMLVEVRCGDVLDLRTTDGWR
jgi:hypothetical protein